MHVAHDAAPMHRVNEVIGVSGTTRRGTGMTSPDPMSRPAQVDDI